MNTRKLKQGIKRASKLSRKGAKKAAPALRVIAPIAVEVAAETVAGAPIVRVAKAVIRAKNRRR